MKPAFFLASSEGYGLEEPRRCYVVREIHTEDRRGLLLVRAAPPIRGEMYGLTGDYSEIVLAPRAWDLDLLRIAKWPADVHVALLKARPDESGFISRDDLDHVAWAELYETGNAARAKRF